MENLEVMEFENGYFQAWKSVEKNVIPQILEKNVLYSHVHLWSFIERINIYINIYSFNQTIVYHSFVSFIHRDFTKCLVMEIWFKVMEKHPPCP